MAQGFEITVTRDGEGVLLAVAGELDLALAPAVLAHVEGAADRGGASIVLDLGGFAFIDSTGLRALLTAHEHCGERLTIIPGPACERRFEVAGVRGHRPRVDA